MMKEAEFNGNGSKMEYSFFTVAKIVPFVVKKIRNTDIFLVKEKNRIFFKRPTPPGNSSEFPPTRPCTFSTKAMSAKNYDFLEKLYFNRPNSSRDSVRPYTYSTKAMRAKTDEFSE